LKKQEKGKSVTCPKKTALTLTMLEPSLFPSMLTPYHYWNGGQPLSQTMIELNITKDIWGKHTVKPYPENAA